MDAVNFAAVLRDLFSNRLHLVIAESKGRKACALKLRECLALGHFRGRFEDAILQQCGGQRAVEIGGVIQASPLVDAVRELLRPALSDGAFIGSLYTAGERNLNRR